MSAYWESHRKSFNGIRLAWYGDAANEEFWLSYWRQRLSAEYYQQLTAVRLTDSVLGQALQQELRTSDRILEAGCGSGNWVAVLKAHGYLYVQGIDYSGDLVNHINRIAPELDIKYGNSLNIPVEDGYYDKYLSFGVVEHRVEGPDLFLKEAFRVIKRGGKAIFTVPCVGPLRQFKAVLGRYKDNVVGTSFFQYGFQQNEFTSLLKQHGFQMQSCRYFDLDRMLLEELKLYRWLSRFRRIRVLQKGINSLFKGIDGHMLLFVCVKP